GGVAGAASFGRGEVAGVDAVAYELHAAVDEDDIDASRVPAAGREHSAVGVGVDVAVVHARGSVWTEDSGEPDAFGLAVGPEGAKASLDLAGRVMSAGRHRLALAGVGVQAGNGHVSRDALVLTGGIADSSITAPRPLAHGNEIG